MKSATFTRQKSANCADLEAKRWPAFTWHELLIQDALQAVEAAQRKLQAFQEGSGAVCVKAVQQDLWSQEALATAAIEGQSLDVEAVRSSVGNRLGISVASSKDRDVAGLVQLMH